MTTLDSLADHPDGSQAARTRVRESWRLSPWFLSLLLHMALLGAMVLVVFPYTAKPTLSELPLVTGEILTSVDAQPVSTREAVKPVDRPAAKDGPSLGPSRTAAIATPVTARASLDSSELKLITTQAEAAEFAMPGATSGAGELTDFGLEMGGGGSSPEFFGVGRSARGAGKFVYVVDRSGSMHGTLGVVFDELRKSISGLRRSQRFHVVFFNDAAPLESPARRLVNAIEANRRETFEFFERVSPSGKTRPETGLVRAFELEPDVIYLLTDGEDFPPDIHERLAELNPRRATRIFVIGFLSRAGRPVLERIARENNGEFRFVSEDDLP